jgi:hypothetical protein
MTPTLENIWYNAWLTALSLVCPTKTGTQQGYNTLSISPQWWLSPTPAAPYHARTLIPDFSNSYTFQDQATGILHRRIIQVTEVKLLLPVPPQLLLPNLHQPVKPFAIATNQARDQVTLTFAQINPPLVIYVIAAVGQFWKLCRYMIDPSIDDTSTGNNIIYELNTPTSVLHWQTIFSDLQTVYQNFPINS